MEERSSWVWEGKPWEAFKSFAIIFSFAINFILIIVLLLLAPLVFPVIVTNIADPIVGGLNDSFVMMNSASISQTIPLDTEMALVTSIPLQTETRVRITEPVPLNVDATFVFPDGGGQINGAVFLTLPPGTELPIELNMAVPVSQTIPVVMSVPVEIELSETDLGEPFDKLEGLFSPLDSLVTNLPASNEDLAGRVQEAVVNPD